MFTQIKMKRDERGFTLIELLIVVAIIAILAAIAIPQFSTYRIRGYNSAANSDIRNLKIAEEAFMTDWQVYASTVGCVSLTPACAGGGMGAGALLAGPVGYTVTVTAATIGTPAQYPSATTTMSFGLSNGIIAGITTTAATGANYTAYTSHTNGDTIYAADSDRTQIKQAGKTSAGAITTLILKVPGAALTAVPASTADATTEADLLAATGWTNM